MVAINVVGRFRQQNDLHAYRRKLSSEVGHDFVMRLLPALADLPLDILDADGTPRTLGDALRAAQHLTLSGPVGSGRRLALQQWALRWAAGSEPGAPQPTLLALPRIDDGASPPDRLLAAFARAASRPGDQKPTRDTLSLFRRGMAALDADEQRATPLLLIHGWDDLSSERRAVWRSALVEAPTSIPAAHLVVALPPGEPAWPGFRALRMAPVTPALLRAWIEQLAPAEHRAAVMDALGPGGPLHHLSGRLFDVALVAWLAPRAGLPRTRADLYAQALAHTLGLPPERLAGAPAVAELQLLAAYGERPSKIPSGLVEPGAGGALHFVYPQVRRYLAARQLAAERRYELLLLLEPDERAEVAPLVAAIIDDAAPVYSVLWRDGHPDAAAVLALGRCLCERGPDSPTWALRVSGALAQLARQGAPALRGQAQDLLREIVPALAPALAAAARADEASRRFVARLLSMLPDELAVPRMTRLVFSSETPDSFAWPLADILLERANSELAAAEPPAEPRALARWVYVQAVRASTARQRLAPEIVVAGLGALAGSQAGETRKLRAAAALLEDPAQPPAARLAALALLGEVNQPGALTVIERASNDPNPDIRRAALVELGRYDPDRAAVALGRAALDGAAAWDLRLTAIQRLGDFLSHGAGRLLERCAADMSLPLYARLQAITALGHGPEGAPHLHQTLAAIQAHDEVRAAAARALGATRADDALPELLRLIENPRADSALLEGCCDGLGALGNREASGPLLRLIDRAADNVPLTIAAARALGRIGDPEASEPLGRLLGVEALDRLQRNLEPRLPQQTVEECLEDPALPAPVAQRLASALASTTGPEARPTTLIEFLISEAESVRAAAACALAAIGGNSARAALLAALLDDATGGATDDVIAALAQVEGPESADALAYLLDTPDVNPLTRWQVVSHLTDHPAGEEVMRRGLTNPALDPFTRGSLAEGLGRRGALAALPALRQLADDRDGDAHLRAQALLALGLLNDPTTETTLIRLIGDQHEDLTVRGLAAQYLPDQLSNEGRRFLRDLLRSERPPAPIAIGALKTLGRVRDRESLPLLLRYCQDETTVVAQAAIAAVTDLGDGSVAPMLVRIAQHPAADHALRLQAVGALLRIGGEGYRPLIRVYLAQGSLPMRLQALEHLIAAATPTAKLLAMLTDRDLPVPLRLRLIEHLAGDLTAAPALIGMLENKDDVEQIRALSARALGQMRWADALPALTRMAEREDTCAAVRLRCIEALGAIGVAAAWATISRLAEDDAQPAEIRDGAIQALRRSLAAPDEE